MIRKVFALLFFAATFAVAVNAQCGDPSVLGWMMAGPCAERAVRQGYAAPVDFMLNNGIFGGYGYYGNGRVVTALVAGAAGGLIANAIHRHDDREYVRTPDGRGQAYYAPNYVSTSQGREVRWAEPKPQKPLDCHKPAGKRGKNEAACTAAEQEQARREAEARAEAERQALANSPWRLYNRSGFTVEVFDGERKLGRMRPNQSWRMLEPETGLRAMILAPDFSGAITEHEARIRPTSDFQGWVITSPKPEEE